MAIWVVFCSKLKKKKKKYRYTSMRANKTTEMKPKNSKQWLWAFASFVPFFGKNTSFLLWETD